MVILVATCISGKCELVREAHTKKCEPGGGTDGAMSDIIPVHSIIQDAVLSIRFPLSAPPDDNLEMNP